MFKRLIWIIDGFLRRGIRPTKDEYFLAMAKLASTRRTCARRGVGCVLVDENGFVLATGYNGVPSGFKHCNEGHECPSADAPSGTSLSGCYATHAEINALAQCRDHKAIHTVYTTLSPCDSCVKALLSTGAKRLVFLEEYPHPVSRHLWEVLGGREWVHHKS